jgi:hypothetical protein
MCPDGISLSGHFSFSARNCSHTKTRRGFGTPASSIVNLRSRYIEVLYRVGGVLDDIQFCLQNSYPVIAFVQAGELPHLHRTRAQHAILIVGLDDRELFLHDPAIADNPIAVPLGDFRLAWDELDNRYAVITRQK